MLFAYIIGFDIAPWQKAHCFGETVSPVSPSGSEEIISTIYSPSHMAFKQESLKISWTSAPTESSNKTGPERLP